MGPGLGLGLSLSLSLKLEFEFGFKFEFGYSSRWHCCEHNSVFPDISSDASRQLTVVSTLLAERAHRGQLSICGVIDLKWSTSIQIYAHACVCTYTHI